MPLRDSPLIWRPLRSSQHKLLFPRIRNCTPLSEMFVWARSKVEKLTPPPNAVTPSSAIVVRERFSVWIESRRPSFRRRAPSSFKSSFVTLVRDRSTDQSRNGPQSLISPIVPPRVFTADLRSLIHRSLRAEPARSDKLQIRHARTAIES